MKKNNLIKALGGASIMLSAFLLLAIFSNLGLVVDGAKYALSGEKEEFRQTALVYPGKAVPPTGLIEGFFDVQREGDITTKGKEGNKEIVRHYRAIQSDKLKETEKQPVLKLQVYNDEKKSWTVTEITKMDQNDGKVYFLLKSEEDGSIIPNNYYTGTYQLIFE